MPGGSVSDVSERSGRQGSEPFLIEMGPAYYHPDHRQNFMLQWIGDTLFANGPGLGQRGYEVIATLPVGRWTQLRDGQGQVLPAAVIREETGRLLGAWL
jgi:hypothetical protein